MDVLEDWFCHPIMEICLRGLRETGKLPIEEIWVSRIVYDGLSDLLINRHSLYNGPPSDEQKSEWKNGLIILQTPGGKITIRLARL